MSVYVPPEKDDVPSVGHGSNWKDWSDIIGEGAKGAGAAIERSSKLAESKQELKEKKRRRMAEMLARALQRNTNLYQLGEESAGASAGNRSQIMQDVARGFVESYRR